MKSFEAIMAGLMGMFRKGTGFKVPAFHHSFGSSKRHNKNRAPNPTRRAHKPLYGGMPHRLDRMGQVPAPTPAQVRWYEHTLGERLMVTWQGLHGIRRIVKLNRFGKPMGKARRVPGDLLVKMEDAIKAPRHFVGDPG